MSRRHKNPYELNENRNHTRIRPYGLKGWTYSNSDTSIVGQLHKKSARQAGQQEIRKEIDELIDEWQDSHRLEEIEIFGGDPKEYVRLPEYYHKYYNQPFVFRWLGY